MRIEFQNRLSSTLAVSEKASIVSAIKWGRGGWWEKGCLRVDGAKVAQGSRKL